MHERSGTTQCEGFLSRATANCMAANLFVLCRSEAPLDNCIQNGLKLWSVAVQSWFVRDLLQLRVSDGWHLTIRITPSIM